MKLHTLRLNLLQKSLVLAFASTATLCAAQTTERTTSPVDANPACMDRNVDANSPGCLSNEPGSAARAVAPAPTTQQAQPPASEFQPAPGLKPAPTLPAIGQKPLAPTNPTLPPVAQQPLTPTNPTLPPVGQTPLVKPAPNLPAAGSQSAPAASSSTGQPSGQTPAPTPRSGAPGTAAGAAGSGSAVGGARSGGGSR